MKTLDAALKTALAEARVFETKRDFDSVAEILKEIWADFSQPPDTTGLTVPLKAEFLRLCGNFLVCYGRAKGYAEYQETGKNLLSNADYLFKMLGDKTGEAKTACHLSLSYAYDGRLEESLVVSTDAERLFAPDSDDQVYLLLKTRQLIALSYLERFTESIELIEVIGGRVEACEDEFISVLFFNQCGYVFTQTGKHDIAVKMYAAALRTCEKIGDDRSAGQTANNLANALHKCGKLKSALESICKAIALALKHGDIGFLSIFEDTKANVLIALGDTVAALRIINQTLSRLSRSGDVRTHCEALWTKIEIYFAADDSAEAMLVFAELGEFTRRELGETAAKIYADRLLKKLSAETDDFPTRIERFYPQNAQLSNLPTGDCKFFSVPARFACLFGQTENLVVCAAERRTNPVIMRRGETGEFFIGNLDTDSFMDLKMYVLKNDFGGEEFFSPETDSIEGGIIAFAKYKKNELLFGGV